MSNMAANVIQSMLCKFLFNVAYGKWKHVFNNPYGYFDYLDIALLNVFRN